MERDERGDEHSTESTQRASREEVIRRVTLVRKLIQQGRQAGEIKRICSKEFGIRPRVVEKYIARAREWIRRDLAMSKIELQCESIEFYRGVVSDPKHSIQARLRAREQMDRILGLNAGFHITVSEEIQDTKAIDSQERTQIFSDPDYLEFLRQKAAKEDEESKAHETDESPADSDTGPVWEDGDEGAGESGAVA